MNWVEQTLPEFDREMAGTRRILERVPDDRFPWQANATFHSIGWNANHLAEIAGWVAGTLQSTAWDIAPPGGDVYRSPQFTSHRDVVDLFDRNVAEGRQAIAAVAEDDLDVTWSLLRGGQPLFSIPRRSVIRGFVLNHMIHHRAHLCVYLRLNGVEVPGLYSPSGDA